MAQTCAEYENEMRHSLEICINENTGTLARNSSSFLDRDMQPVGGGKVYPRLLSSIENGKTVAKADITVLTAPSQFSPNVFDPPAGISPRADCMNPVPPRVIKMSIPEYPPNALQERSQGIVALDAWIGLDGIPKMAKVISRASSDLERSSLNAIKEWRFEPATCNGKPVEVDTVLEVIYHRR